MMIVPGEEAKVTAEYIVDKLDRDVDVLDNYPKTSGLQQKISGIVNLSRNITDVIGDFNSTDADKEYSFKTIYLIDELDGEGAKCDDNEKD